MTDIHIFHSRQRTGWQAAGSLAGGVLLVFMILAQFLLAVGNRSDRSGGMLSGLAGGLGVLAIGLIARGVFLLRAVNRVTLDASGVHVDGLISRQFIPWQQIASLHPEKRSTFIGMQTTTLLDLLDANGKPLASIPDTIERFDEFTKRIEAHSSEVRGQPTYDADVEQQRNAQKQRKERRTGILAGLFLLLMFGTAFGWGVWEEWHHRQLDRDGVQTEARVLRRYMNRVTPRLEYSFDDAQGRTFTRDASPAEWAWEGWAGAESVPVRYLPSDPNWNYLAIGEPRTNSLGGKFLFLSGGLVLFAATLLTLTLAGVDFKTEDGLVTITRHGRILRQWGKSTKPVLMLEELEHDDDDDADDGATSDDRSRLSPVTVPAGSGIVLSPATVPPPPRRPAGIVVLGVLAIVFGLLGIGRAAYGLFLAPRVVDLGDGEIFVMEQPWWALPWQFGDGLLALCLLLAGVGLILVHGWARRVAIVVGCLQVLSSIGAIVITSISLVHLGEESTSPNSVALIGGIMAAVVVHVLGLVFPLVLVIVLLRKATAAVFEREGMPPHVQESWPK